METKIINGFIWAILSVEEAKEMFEEDSVYTLYPDGTEALIETYEDFKIAKFDGQEFGLELGHEKELLSDWQESCARNNDKRSFDAYLESLID